MLTFEPEALTFGNVRLNQAYNTSICITNTEAHPVEFSLRCTSPRYSVSPNRVKLDGGKSQVVNVRLFVSQATAGVSTSALGGASTPSKSDFLIVKSLFFEHRVPISYAIAAKVRTASRSPSPQRGLGTSSSFESSARIDQGPAASVSPPRPQYRREREASATAGVSGPSFARQEADEAEAGSRPPNVGGDVGDAALRREYLAATRRLEEERLIFDEKSEKVLRILKHKDEIIEDLQRKLEKAFDKKYPDSSTSSVLKSENVSLKEKVLDQTEQIEVLISEVTRLRQEAQEGHLGRFAYDETAELRLKLEKTEERLNGTIASLKAELKETATKLEDARHSNMELSNDNIELIRHNRQLEGTVNALQSEFSLMEKKLRQSSSVQPAPPLAEVSTQAVLPDAESTIGPRVLALYEERAKKAEAEVGILRDRISQIEREREETERRCASFIDQLRLREEDVVNLSARYNAVVEENKALLARPPVVEEPPKAPAAPAVPTEEKKGPFEEHREPKSAVDLDDVAANLWWSYIWHSLSAPTLAPSQSDGSQVAPKPIDAMAAFEYAVQSVLETKPSMASGEDLAAQVVNLQALVAELKSIANAQAMEVTGVRQKLLVARMRYETEIASSREEVAQLKRELERTKARERAHKLDGETKLFEMSGTIRVLSSKSDQHAAIAAARQELLAEKLQLHHIRSELESYQELLQSERNRNTNLQRECDSSKALLESSAVLDTIMNVPGVSAKKLIELFAGSISKLENEVAMLRGENKKLKLKSGGMAVAPEHSALPRTRSFERRNERDTRDSNRSVSPTLLRRAAVSDKRRSASAERSSRDRSRERSSANAGASGTGLMSSLPRRGTAEYRIRMSATNPDAIRTDNVFAPHFWERSKPITLSTEETEESLNVFVDPGLELRDLWDALAPCVEEGGSSEHLLDTLNSAIMGRKIIAQEHLILDLQRKLDGAITGRADSLLDTTTNQISNTETTRIDLESYMRRLELSESSRQMALDELDAAKTKVLQLEKQLATARIFASTPGFSLPGEPNGGHSNPAITSDGYFGSVNETVDNESLLYGAIKADIQRRNDSASNRRYISGGSDVDDSLLDEERSTKDLRQQLAQKDREVIDLKDLVRERTTQLKIMMKTIEAIQDSDMERQDPSSGPHADDFSGGGIGDPTTFASLGLEELARTPLGDAAPSESKRSGSGGFHALVKRVVELTGELSSQTAAVGILEQRLKDLDEQKRKGAARYNSLKAKENANTEMLENCRIEIESLRQQVQALEFAKMDSDDVNKREIDKLVSQLRDRESELQYMNIKLENLTQQMECNNRESFMKWIEEVVLNDETTFQGDTIRDGKIRTNENVLESTRKQVALAMVAPDEKKDAAEAAADSASDRLASVEGLIVGLLVQWREQVGFYPRGATGPISQAETRFMQRVSDLVLAAHERCESAIENALRADEERALVEEKNKFMKQKLDVCLQQLQRYVRRSDAAERVVAMDKKYSHRAHENLLQHVRKEYLKATSEVAELKRVLISERHAKVKTKNHIDVLNARIKKLQTRVAELESASSPSIALREQMAASADAKARALEDNLQQWFRVELPRLWSGLPIMEQDMSTVRNDHSYPEPIRDVRNRAGAIELSSDGASPYLDAVKGYALSEALCNSRAMLAAAELRSSTLMERNSALKDRIIELEGVILRWKDKMDRAAETLAASAAPHASMYYDSVALTPAEVEAGELAMRVEALSQKLFEAEEHSRQLRTQCEQSQERAETMRQLVEHLRRDEKELINGHAEQLARVRVSIEERHAIEIRELRFNYEAEKRHLERELALVADAIQKEMYYDNRSGLDENASLDKSTPQNHRKKRETDDSRFDSNRYKGEGSINDSGNETNVSSGVEKVSDDKNFSTPESVRLSRKLQAMEDRYEIAQNQIKELEDLLRVQRSTFLSMQQHASAAFELSDQDSTVLSDKRVDDLLADTILCIRGLHDSQFAWIKALQSAAENGLPVISGPTEAAMMASELSAQVRTLIAKIRRVKQLWGHVLTETAEQQQTEEYRRQEPPKFEDDTPSSDKFISGLRSLKVRARGIEEELHEVAAVPDRLVVALRDLRARFSNLGDVHSAEVDKIKKECSDAKATLESKIYSLEKDLMAERWEGSNKIEAVRREYETKIKNLQDNMETQSVVNSDQISELHKKLNEERSKFHKALGNHGQAPGNPTQSSQAEGAGTGDYPLYAATHNADEVLQLKKLVSAATQEAEDAKNKLVGLQSQHSAEMEGLRSHFHRFRAAQQEVISALETQISELRNGGSEMDEFSDIPGDHTILTYNQEFGSNVSLQDAQERMMKLAMKHRLKQMELNAVLRAMSATGAAISTDVIEEKNPSGAQAATRAESSTREWGNLGPKIPLREELLEARVAAAEKEIEALGQALAQERQQVSNLKAQLAGGDRKSESLPKDTRIVPSNDEEDLEEEEYVAPPGSDKKLVSYLRRINSNRRSYRETIRQLRSELKTIREDPVREELSKAKTAIAEMKSEVASLREDNARKAKLLANFRSARTADSNAVEQWKHETEEMEERLKRMKQTITSKDNMIRELRSKIETIETAAEVPGDDRGDFVNMTPTELQSRIRSANLELKRCKMRLVAFKERCTEMEQTIEPLKTENERLKKEVEKVQSLRAEVSRKDVSLKMYREQAEKSRSDFEALSEVSVIKCKELEKKIRTLQRELDNSEAAANAMRRDNELTQKRLLKAAQSAASAISTEALNSSQVPQQTRLRASSNNINSSNLDQRSMGSLITPNEAAVPALISTKGAATAESMSGAQREKAPAPQLNPEQVPKAVNIPVSELNEILEAVGGMTPRSDASSSSIALPPGAVPAGGPSLAAYDVSTSGDSSLLAMERQLQGLVDYAMYPPVMGSRGDKQPSTSRRGIGSL